MELLSHEDLVAAKLLPWLPARSCLCELAPACVALSRATRRRLDVQIAPGEDIRYALAAGLVPEFGTLRVPSEGVFLTGALHEPLLGVTNLRIAAFRGAQAPAPVQLSSECICGTIEFSCKRLCLDGLHFCLAMDAITNSDEPADSDQSPPYHIHVEEALLLCRHCHFDAQFTFQPPKIPARLTMKIMSVFERCVWNSSQTQGLVICGRAPTSFNTPEEVATPQRSDANVVHSLSGNLMDTTAALVVANGRRACAITSCEFRGVRHHALLARWDVYLLVENCAVYGRVHIEEGPEVVLRCNPHLELYGNRLPPDFSGLFSKGYLEEVPPERLLRRQSSQRQSKSPPRRRQSSKELKNKEGSRTGGRRASGTRASGDSSEHIERWRALGVAQST